MINIGAAVLKMELFQKFVRKKCFMSVVLRNKLMDLESRECRTNSSKCMGKVQKATSHRMIVTLHLT